MICDAVSPAIDHLPARLPVYAYQNQPIGGGSLNVGIGDSNGYTCTACGAWVLWNTFHFCTHAAPWPYQPSALRPHACPVCLGKTTKPASFYDGPNATGTAEVSCRTCAGKGLVWG